MITFKDDIKQVMMEASQKRDHDVAWNAEPRFRRRRSSSVEIELERKYEIEEEEEEEPRSWNFLKKWFGKSSKDEEGDGRRNSRGKKNPNEQV